MESEMDAFQEIESFEKELVNPKTRRNTRRISELLSDNFLEFGSSGKVIRKRDVLASAEAPQTTTYQLDDFDFRMLGKAHVLVTYRSVTSSREVALRSSIWAKEGGRWKMLHHQSTIVPSGI